MPTRQEILMGLSYNRGLKEFRFWLNNTGEGNVELGYAPDGWKDTQIPSYHRNAFYKGVIRKTSSVTLNFVKDGRDYVRDVYNSEGIEGEIVFTVKRLNTSTFAYDDYYEGLIDLSTLKLDDIGADVQIVDNSFAEKFKKREDFKVNWYDRDSISDYGIAAFTTEDPVITFPAYNIVASAVFNNGFLAVFTADHIVPVDLESSEFDETQTPANVIDDLNGACFLNSIQDRSIKVTGNITGYITPAASTKIKITLYSIILNSAGGQVSKTQVAFKGVANDTVLDFDFDLDYTVEPDTNQSVLLQAELSVLDTYSCAYTDINLFLKEVLSSIPEQERKAIPIYEAFLRIAQIITDTADPFYSDFFGRTDTELTQYVSDGHLSHVTKGRFIRGETLSNEIMPLSLKELFQAYHSILNIGLSIEKVGGVDKIRIEEVAHFFDANVVLDLSSRINENSIKKEVLPDWHFNEVQSGFKSFVYEEAGGLYEFNTKTTYSTVLKAVKNVLNIVSGYRGDTMGINKLRQTGITDNPTEDVSGDENIFVLKSVRGSDWLVETKEAFDSVTGGVDADQSYNLQYSPARNMRRHGMNIRAGLEKQSGTLLKFLNKEKNTKLVTKLTGEGPLSENASFQISTLDDPMWHPEAYVCEVPFDGDDMATLETNLKGLIKLSSTKYGWLLSLEPDTDSRKAELKLLRCNTDYVTPI